MKRLVRLVPAVAALAAVIAMVSLSAIAASENEIRWDQTFDGHEMWLSSLDEALTASTEQNKPLLIDIYSLG